MPRIPAGARAAPRGREAEGRKAGRMPFTPRATPARCACPVTAEPPDSTGSAGAEIRAAASLAMITSDDVLAAVLARTRLPARLRNPLALRHYLSEAEAGRVTPAEAAGVARQVIGAARRHAPRDAGTIPLSEAVSARAEFPDGQTVTWERGEYDQGMPGDPAGGDGPVPVTVPVTYEITVAGHHLDLAHEITATAPAWCAPLAAKLIETAARQANANDPDYGLAHGTYTLTVTRGDGATATGTGTVTGDTQPRSQDRSPGPGFRPGARPAAPPAL